MDKKQGLFMFIDTRNSTKRSYANVEFFDVFIGKTIDHILSRFNSNNLIPPCKCKALGDGLLVSYIPECSLTDDDRFPALLKSSVLASLESIYSYNSHLTGQNPKTNEEEYCLGISMGIGYVYDFDYSKSASTRDNETVVKDIGSLDLTYVFRLNKFASPKGLVVSDDLYESYPEYFSNVKINEKNVTFVSHKKRIDDCFGERTFYSTDDVLITEEETGRTKALQNIAKFSINSCKDIIRDQIENGKYFWKETPNIRFIIFECKDDIMTELYSYYIGQDKVSSTSFPITSEENAVIDGKYENLLFECYFKREIVSYSYLSKYIKNPLKYIEESKERFYLAKNDDEIKAYLNNFELKASSSLALPITDKGKVKWILVLDSEEPHVFKKNFFKPLGISIVNYFSQHVLSQLNGSNPNQLI